jgi:hypothetical protein
VLSGGTSLKERVQVVGVLVALSAVVGMAVPEGATVADELVAVGVWVRVALATAPVAEGGMPVLVRVAVEVVATVGVRVGEGVMVAVTHCPCPVQCIVSVCAKQQSGLW